MNVGGRIDFNGENVMSLSEAELKEMVMSVEWQRIREVCKKEMEEKLKLSTDVETDGRL